MNYHIYKKIISSMFVIASIMLLLAPAVVLSESTFPQLVKIDGNCDHGLHKQPNGPMAALIFCEDALGTYIGLVYYESMGAPVPIKFYNELSKEEERKNYSKMWFLNNRMWQDPIWSSDVTSYAWGPNGRRLFIATSNIYGSGALYELDLIMRKYKQIAPEGKQHSLNDPGPGYLITNITSEELVYQLSPYDLREVADVKETKYKINR